MLSRTFVYFICFLLLVSCSSFEIPFVSDSDLELENLELAARKAWENYPRSPNLCQETEELDANLQDKDYFTVYCHLLNFSHRRELERFLKAKAFLKSPHGEEVLVRDHLSQFGQYNPVFVERLGHLLDWPERSEFFRKTTSKTYDIYFRFLARSFYLCYVKLHSNEKFFQKEKERFRDLVAEKRLDPFFLDKYSLFLHPDYTDAEEETESSTFPGHLSKVNFSEKVTKQAVGFWIRRSIDKTDILFFRSLERLILVYDKEFLQNLERYSDSI